MVKVKKAVRNIKLKLRRYYSRLKVKESKESEIKGGYSVPPELLEALLRKDKVSEEKKESGKEKEGIDLSSLEGFKKRAFIIDRDDTDIDLKNKVITYPLITNAKTGKIMAEAKIYFNKNIGKFVYEVMEPPLTLQDKKMIRYLKRIIEYKIDVDFSKLDTQKAKDYLAKIINNILIEFGLKTDPTKIDIYRYYIERDFLGLGKIEPLLRDNNLEDISCDGIGIPVFVFHRDSRIGSIQTNIVFDKKTELDNFIIRLAQKCNKNISVAEPIVEGALPDGSRVHAVLGTDIARKGSNFTIRKFSKEPLTPITLMKYGSIDSKILAYFWLIIENKLSILVSGPTAAGKTSLLNALSLFIRPDAKIVSIEDTPELRLPHEHWVPEVERPGFGKYRGDKKTGEVNMFDLLKGALRQRPDYIIVGEVRGKEAYVLFQGMATGHAGLATIHADTIDKVIDRLITPPINLPASLLETLDTVVFVKGFRYKNKFTRRITNVFEIEGYNLKEEEVETRNVFLWSSEKDEFKPVKPSLKLKKISDLTGMSKQELIQEIINRVKVLDWMYENNINDFKRVGEIIKLYYYNKEGLLEFINETS